MIEEHKHRLASFNELSRPIYFLFERKIMHVKNEADRPLF